MGILLLIANSIFFKTPLTPWFVYVLHECMLYSLIKYYKF